MALGKSYAPSVQEALDEAVAHIEASYDPESLYDAVRELEKILEARAEEHTPVSSAGLGGGASAAAAAAGGSIAPPPLPSVASIGQPSVVGNGPGASSAKYRALVAVTVPGAASAAVSRLLGRDGQAEASLGAMTQAIDLVAAVVSAGEAAGRGDREDSIGGLIEASACSPSSTSDSGPAPAAGLPFPAHEEACSGRTGDVPGIGRGGR